MGLSRAAIGWLIEEHQRRPFAGTLLTLGVQNVFLDRPTFEQLAHDAGAQLGPVPDDLPEPLVAGTITADEVFRRLGFARVVTTDVDDFEGCDFVFDLNAEGVQSEHAATYDMVLDGGTLEHVFHLPNAFRNLIAFTAPGGRIAHLAPSSNHIDHGFHMFSPTLFWDYYAANGLELPRFDLFRYRSSVDDGSPWDFASYTPGSLGKQMFGGLGGGCFGLALVAEKTTDTDGSVIPQQGMYAQAWAEKAPPGLASKTAGPIVARLAWKRVQMRFARLLPVDWRIRWKAARRRFPLPVRRRF